MNTTRSSRKSARPVKASKKAAVASPDPASLPGAAEPKLASRVAPVSSTASGKAKQKLVRDSFTIPKSEYVVLEALKDRAAKLMQPVKKSELLRAGIGALDKMTDKAFLSAVSKVPVLRTGRPKAIETDSAASETGK